MTARDIQHCLIKSRYRQSFCVPNYTPKDWFECDVMEITKAGYIREYEIKISRADFLADRNKFKRTVAEDGIHCVDLNKHDLLAARSPRCPKQFYYVFPAGLMALDEVPEWAGVIVMQELDDRYGKRIHEGTLRQAPTLNNQPPKPEIRAHAETVFYWRFHNLFLKQK